MALYNALLNDDLYFKISDHILHTIQQWLQRVGAQHFAQILTTSSGVAAARFTQDFQDWADAEKIQ